MQAAQIDTHVGRSTGVLHCHATRFVGIEYQGGSIPEPNLWETLLFGVPLTFAVLLPVVMGMYWWLALQSIRRGQYHLHMVYSVLLITTTSTAGGLRYFFNTFTLHPAVSRFVVPKSAGWSNPSPWQRKSSFIFRLSPLSTALCLLKFDMDKDKDEPCSGRISFTWVPL
jgi:hypothetical protein